jgi:hypothetical protein
MATWSEVMDLVRTLDEQRRRTGRIDEGHAGKLVDTLVEFQRQLVGGSVVAQKASTAKQRSA